MKRSKGMRLPGVVLLLAAALQFGGCSAGTIRALDAAKQLANNQDYASLAAIDTDCNEVCDGCNQLHLLKGDACYRLAKNGQEPLKHYQCAAEELGDCVRITKQWQGEGFSLDRARTYTNLSESLRNVRDLSKGSEADAVNGRLLKTAKQFLAVEPGNACAVYYLNNAQYAQQRGCLLHPETCPGLCSQLQGMQQSLADTVAKSAGADCAPNLKELGNEIALARDSAQCR